MELLLELLRTLDEQLDLRPYVLLLLQHLDLRDLRVRPGPIRGAERTGDLLLALQRPEAGEDDGDVLIVAGLQVDQVVATVVLELDVAIGVERRPLPLGREELHQSVGAVTHRGSLGWGVRQRFHYRGTL